ncbi:MAG: hypothetical protein E5W72_03175 [Mesorhizobium sp.]|uniref:hypothetical protein n=1 Tax=Mesorhizobium sp. TaxID=1871066 RepID=UPI0011FB87E7|nr:hypothetical protein [Mesorhizobium sp.]TIT01673.1 MAG: hypothetical protein E5W87_13690 [Mesorhizobium sp.]TIT54619.1 MAG: hypothetical protein E5W72_03175 [Mesorhizobium sp.]
MQRIVSGALAGLAATLAMTIAMRRLHALLENRERYPLPPREIVERVLIAGDEQDARTSTLLAHFGFGALTGSVFALLPVRRGSGVLYGLGVWALSYLGWIPAAHILAPAWRHPVYRNLLMLAVHVVWGATLSTSLSELEAARTEVFGRPTGPTAAISEIREEPG